MKRILIVKMWALGDILMATPLLAALRTRDPDIRISWLVDSTHAEILAGHPGIDELISVDSGAWRSILRKGNLAGWLAQAFALRADMRRRRFDAVINCHPNKWWSMFFCTAPLRVGLYPSRKLPSTRLFYTQAVNRASHPPTHNTAHYLRAIQALGFGGSYSERMVLGIPASDRQTAEAFLEAQPGYDPHKPLIVLHPGTSQDTKCWPPAYFAQLVNALQSRYNLVITGSPTERKLADQIIKALPAQAVRPLIAAGALPRILQTAALLERSMAVVTGDTSVLHMASALDVPLVGIYGSSRPGDNVPLFGRNRLLYDDTVVCAPCYKSSCPLAGANYLRCQQAITPDLVLNALETLLQPTKASYEHSLS